MARTEEQAQNLGFLCMLSPLLVPAVRFKPAHSKSEAPSRGLEEDRLSLQWLSYSSVNPGSLQLCCSDPGSCCNLKAHQNQGCRVSAGRRDSTEQAGARAFRVWGGESEALPSQRSPRLQKHGWSVLSWFFICVAQRSHEHARGCTTSWCGEYGKGPTWPGSSSTVIACCVPGEVSEGFHLSKAGKI